MGSGKLSGKPDEMLGGGGVTCNGLASQPGGVAIRLVTSCYRKWGKLWFRLFEKATFTSYFEY